MTETASGTSGRSRLSGRDRCAALVEAAAALLLEDGIDAVSMDAVAARAGVSRPLVYKHFANRDALLADVYQHKAAELDAIIVAAVREVADFEGKVRALLRAAFEAETTYGPVFLPLLRAGAAGSAFRREQRRRDRRTVRFFAQLAIDEFHLDHRDALAATSVLLTGLASIQAQYRAEPTPTHRRYLEDLYTDLFIAGLTARVTDH